MEQIYFMIRRPCVGKQKWLLLYWKFFFYFFILQKGHKTRDQEDQTSIRKKRQMGRYALPNHEDVGEPPDLEWLKSLLDVSITTFLKN